MGGFAVLAALLAPDLLVGQLPPEIQADRYLMQAEEQIQKQDFAAAKAALDRILDLEQEHGLAIPEAFYFRYAEGLYEEAIKSVTRYLTTAGQDGEHYVDALRLLNSAKAAGTAGRETRAAPEQGRPAGISAGQTCAGNPRTAACWMELADQPGCYVWNDYLQPDQIRQATFRSPILYSSHQPNRLPPLYVRPYLASISASAKSWPSTTTVLTNRKYLPRSMLRNSTCRARFSSAAA